jgi:hypothetical protein
VVNYLFPRAQDTKATLTQGVWTKNNYFILSEFELCIVCLLRIGADTSDKHFTELEK